MTENTTITSIERVAGLLVVAEGIALFVLALWQVLSVVVDDTDSLASALALIVLTILGAAAVAAFGAGVLRGRSWGRSGGIVTQLLILAVAGGAATGAYAHPLTGAEIGVPAVIVLILLALAVVRAARRATRVED